MVLTTLARSQNIDPSNLPDPKDIYNPSEAVNSKLLCYDGTSVLQKICVGYHLQTCDKVGLSLNVTYGSKVMLKVDLDEKDINQKQCIQVVENAKLCIGVKGTPILKPNFAKICPELGVVFKIDIPGIGPVDGESENIELDCLEIGSLCEATSCTTCNEVPGCGWCGKHNVCMSRVLSSPYCETCDSGWTPVLQQCPGYEKAKSGGGTTDESSTNSGSGLGSGDILAIVFGVIAMLLLGLLVYKKANAKGQLLKHDPTLAKFSQPVTLDVDSSESYPERYTAVNSHDDTAP